MHLTKLRTKLLLISLILSGCGSLPPFPEVNQCGYSVKYNKFRCCNTETKKCVNVRREDSRMEAAQCLSGPDYKKSEAWVQSVIDIANQHCH